MPFAVNIAIEQAVISWPPLCLRYFYLHASDVHQHTFNRSRVATLL